MKSKDMKFRLIISAAGLLITVICTILSVFTTIETTSVKIIGSFVSVVIVSAVTWKFPKRFFVLAILFDIFAAALGSVINLYKYIGFYDRFVHYLSGILLAEAGMIIISKAQYQKRYTCHAGIFIFLFIGMRRILGNI